MSEPQHIKEILPGVMADIRGRMERRSRHRDRVVSAVADFIGGITKRPARAKKPTIFTGKQRSFQWGGAREHGN